MKKHLMVALMVLPLLAGLLPSQSEAQSDAPYLSSINFRFSNPGARARGLGGVLVPMSDDDATAAYVNPAGLAFFTEDQFTLEAISEEDEFPAARRETGLDFNTVTPLGPPRRPRVMTDSRFVSFGSYLYPIRPNKFGMSLFYARPLDTKDETVNVSIDTAFFPEIDPTVAFRPISNSVSATNEVAGVSFGYRLHEDFAVGLAVGVSRLDFRGEARRGTLTDSADIVNSQRSEVDAETDAFVTVGGLWRVTRSFSIGASWQKQTSYDMVNVFETTGGSSFDRTFASEFTIPTRSALGFVYRKGLWTVGLEADYIQYSDLFVGSGDQETFFGVQEEDPNYRYAIPDVTELHVGVERIFTTPTEGNSWSLRFGYWRDEAHVPFYAGDDPLLRAWAPEVDENIDHWTVGLGWETPEYAIGFAADHAPDGGTDVLASLIFKGVFVD